MKRIILAALTASALGVLGAPALAQPLHEGSPLAMLGRLQVQLNLNTSQQLQWDNVMAQGESARAAAQANFEQVNTALQSELAKSEPDFAAVAAVAEGVQQQNAALHRQTRDAWLALYATFSPEQKALARDAIKAGIENMQARRAARAHGPVN
jgi:Spy/CpxP family protein refolding chaperone